MPRRTALILAVAWLAQPAHAELVEVDLNAPGDGLVTRDTETGLDWLDLGGVTTNLSYDEIQGGAGGWLASGWRYATQAEVCAFFVSHAGVPTCTSSLFPGTFPEDVAEVVTLLEATGELMLPTEIGAFVQGFYDDGTGGNAGDARLLVGAPFPPSFWVIQTSATPDAIAPSTASSTRGSFLVRPTPPEVPAMPPAGLAVGAALLLLTAWLVERDISHPGVPRRRIVALGEERGWTAGWGGLLGTSPWLIGKGRSCGAVLSRRRCWRCCSEGRGPWRLQ